MSKKKTPKSALHGLIGGTFFQKKKISVSNIKHSEHIFGYGSKFSNNKLGGTELSLSGAFFLGLAVTTSKAKKVIIDLVGGFSIGTIDFGIDEDIIHLPSSLNISLEKRLIDPKIVKTQVEVPIKKFFVLDINLFAVKGKLVTAKTQFIKKIFSLVNGFGGATSLTREKRIITNKMIVAALAEFGKIKSIKIQLIRLWQKAMVEFAEIGQAVQLAAKWFFLIGKNSV
ncbi:hypothetical protein G9A89_005636 [Geosiphon pyriformis]|nr:hypothetical protein G9A89_005636 [Geosiphon pyriformis]